MLSVILGDVRVSIGLIMGSFVSVSILQKYAEAFHIAHMKRWKGSFSGLCSFISAQVKIMVNG